MAEERLGQDQLAALLADATKRVVVGGRYQHYKQQYYVVLDVALLEATNTPAVIYRAEYGAQITFIRPLGDWEQTVTVEGELVPRFSFVG